MVASNVEVAHASVELAAGMLEHIYPHRIYKDRGLEEAGELSIMFQAPSTGYRAIFMTLQKEAEQPNLTIEFVQEQSGATQEKSLSLVKTTYIFNEETHQEAASLAKSIVEQIGKYAFPECEGTDPERERYQAIQHQM